MAVRDCKLSNTLDKKHLLVGRKGPNKLAREDTTPKVSAKFWYLQLVEENIFLSHGPTNVLVLMLSETSFL